MRYEITLRYESLRYECECHRGRCCRLFVQRFSSPTVPGISRRETGVHGKGKHSQRMRVANLPQALPTALSSADRPRPRSTADFLARWCWLTLVSRTLRPSNRLVHVASPVSSKPCFRFAQTACPAGPPRFARHNPTPEPASTSTSCSPMSPRADPPAAAPRAIPRPCAARQSACAYRPASTQHCEGRQRRCA